MMQLIHESDLILYRVLVCRKRCVQELGDKVSTGRFLDTTVDDAERAPEDTAVMQMCRLRCTFKLKLFRCKNKQLRVGRSKVYLLKSYTISSTLNAILGAPKSLVLAIKSL